MSPDGQLGEWPEAGQRGLEGKDSGAINLQVLFGGRMPIVLPGRLVINKAEQCQ